MLSSEHCFKMYLFCIKSNICTRICVTIFFEANMKQMMRINYVCECTETYENEANKIYIRLDLLRIKKTSLEYTAHHVASPYHRICHPPVRVVT
jgi:hypothetical protein